MEKFKVINANTLLSEAFTKLRYFHAEDEYPAAIPYIWVEGSDPLIVVLGDNASGKSFFRRILSAISAGAEQKIEVMPISMQGRSQNFGGLRGMIYGDESWESTGVNSSRTVTSGVKTCLSRTNPHVIIWDEPDIGLSDDYAAGVGLEIAKFSAETTDRTIASVVITHRKALVEQLVPTHPHYVYLGDLNGPKNITEWLQRPTRVRSLAELREASDVRFKAILRIEKSKDKVVS